MLRGPSRLLQSAQFASAYQHLMLPCTAYCHNRRIKRRGTSAVSTGLFPDSVKDFLFPFALSTGIPACCLISATFSEQFIRSKKAAKAACLCGLSPPVQPKAAAQIPASPSCPHPFFTAFRFEPEVPVPPQQPQTPKQAPLSAQYRDHDAP